MRKIDDAFALLLLFVLTLPTLALAGDARESRAARTPSPPALDGKVDESVWSLAPAITGFEQQRPDNGEPSSEEIRVHVLYDDDAIYVGAVMQHRRSPVVRLLARRDTFLDSDWFGILLDSQHDRRTGWGFFVNPDGVQLDEAISDDNVEDFDWDATWQSATSIRPDGWSAELRIPLSQLRFTQKEKQVWGVNFVRWVRARQEQARWISHPRNQKGFVSRFGDLVGIEGIRPRPRLEILPYGTFAGIRNDAVTSPDPFDQRSEAVSELGGDLRWTTRSSVTVSATLNPDFGQVEVDPAILNLSEFELFFPEKRPFFTEGAKLFAFGSVASVYPSPYRVTHPLLFYSRRIGREPQLSAGMWGDFIDAPTSTRILGAAKIIGRSGNQTSFTLVDAVTDDEFARSWRAGEVTESLVQPLTNFFAGRATRDFGEYSRMGVLFTSMLRDSRSETPALTDRATVAGVDGYSYLRNGTLLVDWMVAGSEVHGSAGSIRALQLAPAHSFQRPDADHLELNPSRTSLSGWGGKAVLSRETGPWRYQLGLQSYSPGFELNELGFHPRSDLTAGHAQLTWLDVKKRPHTRNNRMTLGYYRSENGGRETLTNGLTAQYTNTLTHWWTTSATLSYGAGAIDDRETRGGPAIRKPAGWSSQLRLTTNTARPFWFDLSRNDAGDENGGSTELTQAVIAVRPRSNITAQIGLTHATTVVASKYFNSLADPAGLYGRRYLFGQLVERRLEIGPRLDWTIKRSLTLQLFLQPLAASGTYSRIGELQRSRGSYRPYDDVTSTAGGYSIDPDGDGPQSSFSIGSPDFTFRSFRGNAVVRWEVGPATVFVIWNQGRQLRLSELATERVDELRSISDLPAEDRLLIKVSYRFELPR